MIKLETRIKQVLNALLEHELGSPAMDYTRVQVTSTPASKVASPPPPGVHLGTIDSERCPPLGISPYAHFRWMFDHSTVQQRLGVLHAAERLLHRLEHPVTLDPGDSTYEDDRYFLVQGARSGDEVNEIILAQYEGYDADTVDLIEGLKPGTTRKVRKSNFCDELGERKGVPKWAYREFEMLDELAGKDAVMERFQIAPSTYYDVRRKIRDGAID